MEDSIYIPMSSDRDYYNLRQEHYQVPRSETSFTENRQNLYRHVSSDESGIEQDSEHQYETPVVALESGRIGGSTLNASKDTAMTLCHGCKGKKVLHMFEAICVLILVTMITYLVINEATKPNPECPLDGLNLGPVNEWDITRLYDRERAQLCQMSLQRSERYIKVLQRFISENLYAQRDRKVGKRECEQLCGNDKSIFPTAMPKLPEPILKGSATQQLYANQSMTEDKT